MKNIKYEVAEPTGHRIRTELYRYPAALHDVVEDAGDNDADVVAWIAERISDMTLYNDDKKFNKVRWYYNE